MMGLSPRPRGPERAVEIGCLGYTALCQFATNSLKATIGDATLFAYGGRLILQGGIPYRDFWDNKPPGIFYIEAFSYWLFGTTWLAPTIVQAAVHLATIAAFAWSARRLAPGQPLLRIAFLVLLTLWMNLPMFTMDGGNLTQNYMLLPLALAIGLFDPMGARPRLLPWAAAGVLAGLAFLIRPNALSLGWLCVLSVLLRVSVLRGTRGMDATRRTLSGLPAWSWRQSSKATLAFAAGGALPLAAVSAYFAAHGVLGEMWFATLTYNVTAYKELFFNRPTLTDARRYFMFEWRFGVSALYAAGLWGTALLFWRQRRQRRAGDALGDRAAVGLLLFVLGWVASDLVLVVATGHPYPHYVLMLVPSAALFASLAFCDPKPQPAETELRRAGRWGLRGLVTALLVSASAPLVGPMPDLILAGIRKTAAPTPTTDQQVALFIRQVALPNDPIMTLGHFHGHMMYLENPPAVPLLSTFHLKSNYGNARWTGAYIETLRRDPPKVVVITDGYWNPYVRRGPVPPGSRARDHERPKIERLLREKYSPAPQGFRGRLVLLRKDLARPRAYRSYLPPLDDSASWF